MACPNFGLEYIKFVDAVGMQRKILIPLREAAKKTLFLMALSLGRGRGVKGRSARKKVPMAIKLGGGGGGGRPYWHGKQKLNPASLKKLKKFQKLMVHSKCNIIYPVQKLRFYICLNV